jgi:hypothetical protein
MLIALATLFSHSAATSERSKKAIAEFRKAHPCAATHKTQGACPGYVIDM